jgi:hypothetical protein
VNLEYGNFEAPCPQLLDAWNEFYAKYPEGEITEAEFMENSKVGSGGACYLKVLL